ncbi:hypothetical protein [Treponema sp.]|uniref:hypothetical protein n=1 Tax=Treponema sp. TaxID=166 RepID=UPI00388DF132
MKKTILKKIAAACVLSAFWVCAGFAQEADAYTETEPTQESDKYEEDDTYEVKTTKKKKSNEWNPFEGIFSSKQANYIFYDEIPLSTGTIGYGIKHRKATAVIEPKTRKAGIQVYYQSAYFDFLFDENNIAEISEALEKYLKDFEEHRLIKKQTAKTRKIYTSKGKCRTEWGSVKNMMNYFGDSKFHVGYEFKDGSPYFCIIVKDCKNLAQDLGSNIPEKSVEVQLYFTKAEAKTLVSVLSRERVKQLIETEYFDEESETFTPDTF